MLLFSIIPAMLALALCSSPVAAHAPSLKHAFTAQVSLGVPVGPVPVTGGETAGILLLSLRSYSLAPADSHTF